MDVPKASIEITERLPLLKHSGVIVNGLLEVFAASVVKPANGRRFGTTR